MRERYEQEKKTQSFTLVHSLFLDNLIQLSNPQPELDFHYASRNLTSNHNQSTISTLQKETKASNTRTLCEYKPKRTLLLVQTRKPYSCML